MERAYFYICKQIFKRVSKSSQPLVMSRYLQSAKKYIQKPVYGNNNIQLNYIVTDNREIKGQHLSKTPTPKKTLWRE